MAVQDILNQIKSVDSIPSILQRNYSLKYNPFPKSGIAIIDEADEVVGMLGPIDDQVTNTIVDYIKDALSASVAPGSGKEKYLSLIIRGDYGSGKTQTLMYIKYLLKNLATENYRPYVVYVDNPGQRLSELIGGIVSQIGIESFRKHLWSVYLSFLEENAGEKELLKTAAKSMQEPSLFSSGVTLTFSVSNYKEFIDQTEAGLSAIDRKTFKQRLKDSLLRCFSNYSESQAVASYFYDIVSDTIGVSKAWDSLISGGVKELDKREVNILRAVVDIVREQMGYTDFVILIDEFEEITAERLKKQDIDNYLRNLRLLIDREKNWCSVFAMTGQALQLIDSFSPPLASRIKDRVIDLKPLDATSLKRIVANYLALAREENYKEDAISPFTDSGLNSLLEVKNPKLKGSPRFLLKACYLLLQRASEIKDKVQLIDSAFVERFMEDLIK